MAYQARSTMATHRARLCRPDQLRVLLHVIAAPGHVTTLWRHVTPLSGNVTVLWDNVTPESGGE
eukprot:765053-Rhodomonas_salina.1